MNVRPNFKPDPQKGEPEYLALVRQLPCCICEAFDEGAQSSITTAHHPIHGRYSGKTRPDSTAIPLCDCHHQATWGGTPGKLAIHKGKESWAERYGEDMDYVAQTQDAIAEMIG